MKVNKIVTYINIISLVIFLISLFYSYENTLFLLLPSLLIIFIISIPILISKNLDIFSPLPYFFYFVFISLFLRVTYIIYDLPNIEFIRDVFLLDQEKSFLILPLIITLISFISAVFGYMIIDSYKIMIKPQRITHLHWDLRKLNLISILLLTVSIVAFYYYIKSTFNSFAFITLDNISSYRGVADDLIDYNANGISRSLIELSIIVFYLSYVRYVVERRLSKLNFLFLIISLIISNFYFFYVQSRAGILFIFINCFIINYYINKKSFSVKKIILLFLFLITIFTFMTSLRAGNGYNLNENISKSIFSVFDPIIANNGGVDISKTGHIKNYADLHGFKYGTSYLWIFFSLIPREFWPQKPANIDSEVGIKIYGATSYGTGGVPPGLIAESYWNFGYFGIVIIPFLCGMLIKKVTVIFLKNNNKINYIILYVTGLMPIASALFGSSFNATVVGFLIFIVPWSIVFILIRTKSNSIIIQ